MSQTVINAHIVGQSIQMANLPLVASGIKGALVIHCDFSAEWSGYGKTAVFYRDATEVYHIPLVGSEAEVPHEVLAEEGFFFFGIMGAADNVRTTEVLRVSVAKGAITTATAEPAEPTLDIYQQLVAVYDKTERDLAVATARFNEAIKMSAGPDHYDDLVGDEYIGGLVSCNGAAAYIDLTITGLSLVAGGHHYTDYFILSGYAPLCPVYLETTNTDINVTIEKADSEQEGHSRILIENVGNSMLTTDMVVSCRGFYPLAYMYHGEVSDIRVGWDGEVYPTAGEAVRAQVGQLGEKVNGLTTSGLIAEEVTPASANLYNDKDPDAVNDYFVNPVDGKLYASQWQRTSGYIPIENGKTYIFPVYKSLYGWSTTGSIPLYDVNKKFIGQASGTITADLLTATINKENAAYFRTTIQRGSSNKYNNSNLMVVEGTEYPSAYIPFRAAVKTPVLGLGLATDYVQALLNPLYKKTILWNGDSICAGKAFDDEGDAWAGRIANRNSMTYKNYAIGGGTITEGLSLNGTATHTISGTLDTMFADYPDADYIIFDGGTNDADIIGSHLAENNPAKFGTYTMSDFSGNYDRNTFCGALESIFHRATNYWKGKKIGYIVAHKMGWSGTGYGPDVSNRRNYFETAMRIAEKWGIPVLNLWDGCYLNPSLTTMWKYDGTWEENKAAGKLYADGQHLLAAGYDYTADIINNWLKTL